MVIIQIYGDAEKVRESHICIIGNACDLPCSLVKLQWPISYNSKSNVNYFYEEFTQGFLTSNYNY